MLAPVVADAGEDGARHRRRLRGQELAGPDIVRVEVVSVLRRRLRLGGLPDRQARSAIDDLLALPTAVVPTSPLVPRCWELRHDVTPYDACYVAVAEALGCELLTADVRLAGAPGVRCRVTVVRGAQNAIVRRRGFGR